MLSKKVTAEWNMKKERVGAVGGFVEKAALARGTAGAKVLRRDRPWR